MPDTPTRPALTAEQRADLRTDYEWDVREGAPWERRTAQAILALLDERDRLEARLAEVERERDEALARALLDECDRLERDYTAACQERNP